MSHKPIPLMMPYVPHEAITAVSETLMTRWIGQGPRVDEFENKFSAQVMDGRPCVAVNSCTSALHIAYLLSRFKKHHNVLVPLFTCTATNEALLYLDSSTRPQLRFVDVAPNSLNMDLRHAKELKDDNTRALVVVHYGGQPVADEFFTTFGVPIIIEDCAQAIGPDWPGTRGTFACFSFQAVKTVTTADGGMLALPELFRAEAKRLRWFGIDREAKLAGVWENDIREVGYKYQMTDVAASMGIAGLDCLNYQFHRRQALRQAYIVRLHNVDGIRIIDTDQRSACWLLTVLVERREDLRRLLRENGIESDQVHYRNDRYSIFKGYRGSFPNMDAIEDKYLVLPLHMRMNHGDVERICEIIRGGW